MNHFLNEIGNFGARFRDSIICYKGKPVYIRKIDGDIFTGYYLDTGRAIHFDANSEEIDTTPVKLGYVNGFDVPVYMQRMPVRRYKQGLSSENISPVFVPEFGDVGVDIFRDAAFHRNLHSTVMGDYPSVEECLELINNPEEANCWAFDRKYSMCKEGGLIYLTHKAYLVGRVDEENGECKLNDEYLFLKEHLQEVING